MHAILVLEPVLFCCAPLSLSLIFTLASCLLVQEITSTSFWFTVLACDTYTATEKEQQQDQGRRKHNLSFTLLPLHRRSSFPFLPEHNQRTQTSYRTSLLGRFDVLLPPSGSAPTSHCTSTLRSTADKSRLVTAGGTLLVVSFSKAPSLPKDPGTSTT